MADVFESYVLIWMAARFPGTGGGDGQERVARERLQRQQRWNVGIEAERGGQVSDRVHGMGRLRLRCYGRGEPSDGERWDS